MPALINAAAAPTSPDDMVGMPDSAAGDMKKDMEGDSPLPIINGGINAPKGGGGGGGGGGGDGGGGGGSVGLLGSSSTSGATAIHVGSLGALVIAAAGAAMF
ncbi:hypothetical protein DFP73DRAFT_524855 [Morchella snyderi]|nr:hypothetical protein DFP73DRAFT_524855 [Morchella snyderi]